jgi:hypothetical protein
LDFAEEQTYRGKALWWHAAGRELARPFIGAGVTAGNGREGGSGTGRMVVVLRLSAWFNGDGERAEQR